MKRGDYHDFKYPVEMTPKVVVQWLNSSGFWTDESDGLHHWVLRLLYFEH